MPHDLHSPNRPRAIGGLPLSVRTPPDVLQAAIFNSANFLIISTDAKGVIQIFNVGAERMLGYAAADVMGKITPAEISDPQEIIARATALSAELGTEITPGFEALVFKASRGAEDIYELTYIRKDGSRFPTVVSVTALRDGPGAIIGFLLIGTDNTARQHVEEQRKHAEEVSARFAAIVEFSDDAIIGKTLEGRITSWNSGAEKLFGYPASAMVGQLVSRLIPPERQHEEAEILRRVCSGDSVRHFDTVRLRQDGSRVDVSITTSGIKNASGKIIGASKIARDITERKLAERALQQSEAEFRALTAVLPQIVWVTRPDGWNTYFSQRWVDYTGLTLEESLGLGWLKPFHPDDQQRASDAWRAATAEKAIYSLECRLRRADGVYRWWWMLAAPSRAPDGTILRWIGTCTDIHERKRVEEALQESEAEAAGHVVELRGALASVNQIERHRSTLFHQAIHDLKNDVVGVSLAATLLGKPSMAESDRRESSTFLTQAVQGLNTMLEELLELARLQAGRETRKVATFDAAALLTELCAAHQPFARERQLFLKVKGPARLVVEGDAEKTRRLAKNLVGNALKYTGRGGVDVTWGKKKETWWLMVKDTGPGMLSEPGTLLVTGPQEATASAKGSDDKATAGNGETSQVLPAPWDATSTATPSRHQPGEGIGLSIVKRLCELLDASIEIASSAETGTTFRVVFPIAIATRQLLRGPKVASRN